MIGRSENSFSEFLAAGKEFFREVYLLATLANHQFQLAMPFRRHLLFGLLTLKLSLLGCMMDTSVNSAGNTSSNASSPAASAASQPMKIEGKIVSIMETWPLQLTVTTSTGRYHVSLLPETIVKRADQPLDVSALRTNYTVQISGYSTEDHAITAELIELQVE